MFFNNKLGVFSSWTPNNVVKNRIATDIFIDDNQSACLLACHAITSDSLRALAMLSDVDFGKSQTKEEPKEYHIDWINQPFTSARFAVQDSTVHLLELIGKTPCDCP